MPKPLRVYKHMANLYTNAQEIIREAGTLCIAGAEDLLTPNYQDPRTFDRNLEII
jgi:hypothetical protein